MRCKLLSVFLLHHLCVLAALKQGTPPPAEPAQLRWPPWVNKGLLKRKRSALCASMEEVWVMKVEIRDRGMCVWHREEAVCGQTKRSSCQAAWGEPGDGRRRKGAGQRICSSVNTSHGEGAHEVKQHISSSGCLCCGNGIRLPLQPPDLWTSVVFTVKLHLFPARDWSVL